MGGLKSLSIRILITLAILIGLMYLPAPAFSQQAADVQNLVQNGDFEAGFQSDFGVGRGWFAFSNGDAAVGWSADTWDKVVPAGQTAQLIEINSATEQNRYAGIFQTIPVVPGQQYKLTLKGLIRSSEGDINRSNYGYRLQYAIDYSGGTAWELLSDDTWQELPWDEQAAFDPESGEYQIETYSTTITATGDHLTLFIRGWKKWINNGVGLYNLDEISLLGPPPQGLDVRAAAAENVVEEPPISSPIVNADAFAQVTEHDQSEVVTDEEVTDPVEPEESTPAEDEISPPESDTSESVEATAVPEEPEADTFAPPAEEQPKEEQLPESGQSRPETMNFGVIIGAIFIILLLVGAVVGLARRNPPLVE